MENESFDISGSIKQLMDSFIKKSKAVSKEWAAIDVLIRVAANRGIVYYSHEHLAKRWGWNVSDVAELMDNMDNEQMISLPPGHTPRCAVTLQLGYINKEVEGYQCN